MSDVNNGSEPHSRNRDHSITGVKLNCSMRIGDYIYGVAQDLKEMVDNKWDGVGLIVGDEGDGKSSFAMQMAYLLDPNFNINNIVFNAEQFEELVDSDKVGVGSCIVWDEADDLSGHWADPMMRALKSKFKRIRKKRLYILLVTPSLFDLSPYFVIHRSRFVFHVYADMKTLTRGQVRFFNREAKRLLVIKGKKEWNMNAVRPNFLDAFGRIPDGFPIDMSDDGEYEIKKDEATKMVNVGKKQNSKMYRNECIRRLDKILFNKRNDPISCKRPYFFSQEEIGYVFDVTRDVVRDALNPE